MKEVTKDEFFKRMEVNVHPRSEKDCSIWVMQDGSRRVIGRSEPGYMNPGDRKRYFIE